MSEIPDAVHDLAMFTITHASGSIIPQGGPLVPFAVVERNGERSLHRFGADRLEEMVVAGRWFVREQDDADHVALAWDGVVTIDGVCTDALFVEASAGGAESSVIVAQRYGVRGFFARKTHVIGPPTVVGTGSLFT